MSVYQNTFIYCLLGVILAESFQPCRVRCIRHLNSGILSVGVKVHDISLFPYCLVEKLQREGMADCLINIPAHDVITCGLASLFCHIDIARFTYF